MDPHLFTLRPKEATTTSIEKKQSLDMDVFLNVIEGEDPFIAQRCLH